MAIIRKTEAQHIIYEHAELECLVAINKSDVTIIKKFWNTNKGKSKLQNDLIKGYRFVFDEEQDSLIIDFDNQEEFEIQYLKKYA